VRPRPGGLAVEVHASDVASACRAVGIGDGDVAMFHSSLSSMGHVVGGPNTVIEGFLEAVGSAGTVCVPTLWWFVADPPMRLEDWDIETSPSYPGAITEALRQRADSVRSNSPTHSISAIGARAGELTRDHGASGLRPCVFGDTAFARESPWQRLLDWNAAYCFLGVDFRVNTMGHFCESVFLERALAGCPARERAALDGRLARWEKPGVYPRHDFRAMGERLAAMGLVRAARVGPATLRRIRTADMVPAILGVLEAEPEQWFDGDFVAWLRDATFPS
jgi:aminoglycoside 3-N-acetyltransferase